MKKYVIYLNILISLIYISCAGKIAVIRDSFDEKSGIKNSIIYLIHGDGSYVYHDSTGMEINADERILEQAKFVAQNSFSSEVFIFHIKPKSNFLFFFPQKDREYFYYNKGKLIKEGTYNTEETYNNFELESRLYKRLSQNTYLNPESESIKSVFLYYGHQIPEFGGEGYNSSYPEMTFNIYNFITGLSQFRRYSSARFELIVLSTCNNGTPGVISKLSQLSKYVIASPEDLHLSYINSTFLINLNYISNNDFQSFVQKLAKNAFENLKRKTQTVVTISVYDMRKVAPFLESIKSRYKELLLRVEKSNTAKIVCTDCQKNKILEMQNAENGVTIYYRPPQFGRSKAFSTHSGWGCLEPNFSP